MRKVLVVNSNTSNVATERIVSGCSEHARPDTQVSYATAGAGPEGIDSVLDIAVSGLETVRVIARNRHDFDAFIVACGMDPCLDAARQVTDKPVIGIAEAGMLIACTLGARFSVVISMSSEKPIMEDLVRHYGLSSRLASVLALDMTTAELIAGVDRIHQRLAAISRKAIDEDLAEVIVLPGAVMGGLEQELAREVGVPAVSGLVCALKLAESLVDLGVCTSHVHKYRTYNKHDQLIGYDDLRDVYSL